MKTSELTGAALDWAVATIEQGEFMDATWWADFGDESCYSSDWAQGGPIIEREKISTSYDGYWVYDPTDPEDNGERWFAEDPGGRCNSYCRYGPTPLIAAMRCYVASKLGDNIELPKELT